MKDRRKSKRREDLERRVDEFILLINKLIDSGRLQNQRKRQRRVSIERRIIKIALSKIINQGKGERRSSKDRRTNDFDELFRLLVKRKLFTDFRKHNRRIGKRRR